MDPRVDQTVWLAARRKPFLGVVNTYVTVTLKSVSCVS